MSMHEIEKLVEITVCKLNSGAPDHQLDLRTLFWNLYDYHNSFDTTNILFRSAAILAQHRYLYHFSIDKHPDFEKYPDYFKSLKGKGFEGILMNPSKPWNRHTNREVGYYCDPLIEWGEDFCKKQDLNHLARPLLYCEAGYSLWERLVANGTLIGIDTERPMKLDQSALFHTVIKEIVRQKDLILAAEWYQIGILCKIGNPKGKKLVELKKNADLLSVRELAAEHSLHTYSIDRGFMDMGQGKADTFLDWWQNPGAGKKKHSQKTMKQNPDIERKVTKAINQHAQGQKVDRVWYSSSIWFDGEGVHCFTGKLEGADPYSIRIINSRITADKNHVWCYNSIVPNVEAETFRVLGGAGGIYAKDIHHVYIEDRLGYLPIPGADPKTFKELDFCFGRDAQSVYYRDQVLQGIGNHFSLNEAGFLQGEGAVYHYGFKLPVDAASFHVVNLQEKLEETNPFLGEFLLADREYTYRYDSDANPPKFARTVVRHFTHPLFEIELIPGDKQADFADLCKVFFNLEKRRWKKSNVQHLLDCLLPPSVRGKSCGYVFENGPSWSAKLVDYSKDRESFSSIQIIGTGVQQTWKALECINKALKEI